MPSSKPILSIILSAYNSEKFIKEAIQSILNQSFKDFELLIADDGSTDRTKSIIDSFEHENRIRICHNDKNKGKVYTANKLFEKSLGKLISIHDADDFSHPDRFKKQIDFLKKNDLAMCGTAFFNIDESGAIVEKVDMPIDLKQIRDNYLRLSQFHGPTMLLKKEIIKKIGGLYRFFRNKEDIDLAVRIVERFNALNLKEPLYYYRNHDQSLSKKGYNYLKFEGMKAIEFLHNERMTSNEFTDSLMKSDQSAFFKYLKELEKPYIEDRGLIYRKSAAHNMYFKFYKSAIVQSLNSIKADPVNILNYRTLLYCLRKAIF